MSKRNFVFEVISTGHRYVKSFATTDEAQAYAHADDDLKLIAR